MHGIRIATEFVIYTNWTWLMVFLGVKMDFVDINESYLQNSVHSEKDESKFLWNCLYIKEEMELKSCQIKGIKGV